MSDMKLIMEGWRQYLVNETVSEGLLTLLNQKRYENVAAAEPLQEQQEVVYEQESLSVGQIYCDMDGVLADFTGGVLNLVWKDLKYLDWVKKTKLDVRAVAAVSLVADWAARGHTANECPGRWRTLVVWFKRGSL